MSELTEEEKNRIIEMAWEDRTPFDVIKAQFGLSEQEVKELMRSELKTGSYKAWRKRVSARKTKHLANRDFAVGRLNAKTQNKIRKPK
jgi:uncharacterized protein (TIGR03643 family)